MKGSRREPLFGAGASGADAESIAFAAERQYGDKIPRLGALGSLGLHLALLLALLFFPLAAHTPPLPPPIPVKLVVVKPPPKPAPRPPPKPPLPEKKPAADRLASVSMGKKAQRRTYPSPVPKTAPKVPKPPSPTPKIVPKAPKPPPPVPVVEPKKPLKPASKTAMAVPLPLEKPPAPKLKPARLEPQRRRLPARPAAPPIASEPLPEYPGPSATRSAYLAYLVALVRQHLGLLPRSMVGNRHGVSVIGITVRDNGTIARVFVLESSGYPDIDRRVEMMVTAVRRFPPLPQLWQAPEVTLNLRLIFPEALLK